MLPQHSSDNLKLSECESGVQRKEKEAGMG
jgi:hypothetical protein